MQEWSPSLCGPDHTFGASAQPRCGCCGFPIRTRGSAENRATPGFGAEHRWCSGRGRWHGREVEKHGETLAVATFLMAQPRAWGAKRGCPGGPTGRDPGWRGEPRNPGLGRNALGHWGGGRGEPRMDADGRERGNAIADGVGRFAGPREGMFPPRQRRTMRQPRPLARVKVIIMEQKGCRPGISVPAMNTG